MNNERSEHIDCSDVPLTYFRDFLADVRNRSETSAPQEHSFLVNELAVRAQLQATRLGSLARPKSPVAPP